MKPKAPFIKDENKVIFSHIAAAAENQVIGLKGKLPWHIPEDLKFFHNITKGKALIMGRKTFESLGKPLPHRLNVVVTRKKDFQPKINTSREPWGYVYSPAAPPKTDILDIIKEAMSLVICSSIESALDFCCRKEVLEKHGPEVFITGGGEIYRETLPFVHRIYLTRIHKNFEGDAFYPEIPEELFQEIYRKDIKEAPIPYSFLTYEKKN